MGAGYAGGVPVRSRRGESTSRRVVSGCGIVAAARSLHVAPPFSLTLTRPVGDSHVKGSTPRALVVDDDPAVRRVAVRALERLGWTVHAVEDGDVALAHLTAPLDPPRYELILCDIRMPRMGGIELYAQLVVQRAEVLPYLVLYSGTLQDEEVARFLSRTAVRTLPKPFAISDLERLAGEILAG